MKKILKYINPILLLVLIFINGIIILALHISKSNDSFEQDNYRVAIVLTEENYSPFWQTIWNGIYKSAEKYPMSISAYYYTSQDEIENLLETALLSNPDGIIFCVPQLMSEELKVLLESKKSEIPLVCIDTDAGDRYRDVFIGVDNVLGGKLMADEISNSFLPDKRIMVVDYTTPTGAIIKRQEGFNFQIKSVAKESEIEAFHYISNDNTGENITKLQEVLSSSEKPDYIVVFSPGSTKMIASIIQASKVDDIVLIGVGEDIEHFEFVRDKTINLLLAQDCDEIGKQSVEALVALFNESQVESEIDCDMVKITPDNIDENELASKIMGDN